VQPADFSPPESPSLDQQRDALQKGLGRAMRWAMTHFCRVAPPPPRRARMAYRGMSLSMLLRDVGNLSWTRSRDHKRG
jgi:hypothetical protein